MVESKRLSWRVFPVVVAVVCMAEGRVHAAPAGPHASATLRLRPKVQEISEASGVLRFDVSSLAGASIHRAQLVCHRDEMDGLDPAARENVEIFPLLAAFGKAADARTAARPLTLVGPWYDRFDATGIVTEWAAKRRNHGLYVKNFPKWRPGQTVLDVTVANQGAAKVRALVKGVKAFHRSGQTFVTWDEIDNTVPAPTIPWGELRKVLADLDAKRQVRYRVYRHDRPITPTSLHLAELLAEVAPLSALNVNARCVEYGIDKRLREVDISIPGPGYPERFHALGLPTRERGVGLDYPVGRYVIDTGADAKPLAPGKGLYVHTVAAPGTGHYAVTVAVDGVARSVALGAQARAVREAPAEPEPVVQGRLGASPHWDYPVKRYHYVQWCGSPKLCNLPSMAFSYGVSVPDRPPPAGPMPMELHFHHRDSSYYRPISRVRTDSLVVLPYDFPRPSGFYGYHESLGTLKSFSQGVVRNYTEERVLSLLRWVRGKWKIDPSRIACFGGTPGAVSSGPSGGAVAMWFGLKHRDFVNAAICDLPIVDTSTMERMGGPRYNRRPAWRYVHRERAWGRREWKIAEAGGRPAWEAQDCTAIARGLKPTEAAPFVAVGGNSAAIQKLIFLLRELRRPSWHESTWGTCPLLMIDGTSVTSDFQVGLRRDRSLPAVTHCSSDSEKHPNIRHSWGVRWDGSTIVDRPGRYEVTLRIQTNRASASVTANVTPRRLQRFAVTPGAGYDWTLSDAAPAAAGAKAAKPQSGRAKAAADGLLTVEGCTLTKAPRRLLITPAGQ